jgi:hypothetical protein
MSDLYAIVENNAIQRIGRAKALWPQVSFPASGPREDWLLEQGAQHHLAPVYTLSVPV